MCVINFGFFVPIEHIFYGLGLKLDSVECIIYRMAIRFVKPPHI